MTEPTQASLIERLRKLAGSVPEHWVAMREAADALEKLLEYAYHTPGCLAGAGYPHHGNECTCGLTQLLRDIGHDT